MIHVEKKDSEKKKIKFYDRKEKEVSLVSGHTLFYWNGSVRVSVKTMCIEV